jgi:hypothetical protein
VARTCRVAGDESGPQADYPVYGSAGELWERADLVAEIVIDGSGVRDRLRPTILAPDDEGYDDPAADALAGLGDDARAEVEAELDADDGIPITVVEARIVRVWKGAPGGATVAIQQLGDSETAAADVTYLADGEEYLVFLETYDDAPASLLNPWQAQYRLDGDAVTGLDHEYALELTVTDLEELRRAE